MTKLTRERDVQKGFYTCRDYSNMSRTFEVHNDDNQLDNIIL